MNNKISRQNSINTFLNNYFNLFALIFVTFLLVAAYNMLLKPKIEETVLTIEDNISQKEKVYQAEKIKLESLQAAVDAYDKIDLIDVERIKAILPEDYDKEKLFGEIDELVTQYGFILNSLSLQKDGEVSVGEGQNNNQVTLATSTTSKLPDSVGIIHMNLSLGLIDYASLNRFLVVLENNLRLMDVQKLSFSDGNTAELEINTYFYKK